MDLFLELWLLRKSLKKAGKGLVTYFYSLLWCHRLSIAAILECSFRLRDQLDEADAGHLVRDPHRPRQGVLAEDDGERKAKEESCAEKV